MDSHRKNLELIVDLQQLAQESLAVYPVDCELSSAWLTQALASTDAQVELPGQLRLNVTPHAGQGVLVQGSLQMTFVVPCARCLESAYVATAIPICVNYVRNAQKLSHKDGKTARSRADEQDEIIEFDSPDQYPFQGHEIDLQPMLLEHILLSYPMRALCSLGEKCQGLCSNCGVNLNHQEPPGLPCARCQMASFKDFSQDKPEQMISSSPRKSEQETPWKAALRRLKNE